MGFSWGGDLGCHVAARHPGRVTALVVLDAAYRDPPLDPSLAYETRVRRNERAWRERCAPSWDVAVTHLRRERPRWTPAIEEGCRAGWTEEDGRLVPAVPAWVVAAAEHGMAHAPPSATRPLLAASRVPMLLIASGEAAESDLARFAAEVPHAAIHRTEGTGHDVLTDGGPRIVRVVRLARREHRGRLQRL
jgi:pimeloyl-ACP methyl ester carboxylesterase